MTKPEVLLVCQDGDSRTATIAELGSRCARDYTLDSSQSAEAGLQRLAALREAQRPVAAVTVPMNHSVLEAP